MIFSTSRYAGGVKGQMLDRHSPNHTTYVFRRNQTYGDVTFFNYTVADSDRLDALALRFLGDETRWWEIMDYNPEIQDPLHLVPGTVLRMPSV